MTEISDAGLPRFPGHSAAILAGGRSSRMGANKALLDVGGDGMLLRTAALLRPLVDDLFVVANDAAPFAGLGLRITPDIHPGCGPSGGIHAALLQAAHPLVLCVACDMPLLERGALELLLGAAGEDADAILPLIGGYPEPLLAVYARSARAGFERALRAGQFKVVNALEGLRVRYLDEALFRAADPELRSFANVNTPDELAAARIRAAREGACR